MKTSAIARKRALIVDDEAPGREDLRELLLAHPEIEVVAEAKNVTEALAQYQRTKPDLIFLDVQMPKRDGFSLLPELRPVPDIIFTTAYDCFAVKAFEVNAVDYLIKPIFPDRLALALMRLDHSINRKAKPFAQDDRVFLFSDSEMRVVIAKDITHIAAVQNYSRVHVANGKMMLVRRRMGEWRKLLPPKMFVSADRSNIVNLRAVKEIMPLPHHHAEVSFISPGASLELRRMASRRLRKAIRDLAAK